MGRINISDNNSAQTTNRLYFGYNHFHNNLLNANGQNVSLDQFTLGAETRFFDGDASLEFRMPFYDNLSTGSTDTLATNVESIGNLSLIYKQRLVQGEAGVFSIGLAVTVPTGDDVNFQLGGVGGDSYIIHNEVVHLAPFGAFLWTVTDNCFIHGFAEVDFATTGNPVEICSPGLGCEALGRLNSQTSLFTDIGAGCWLYRDATADGITGISSNVELHFATALQDADVLQPGTNLGRWSVFSLTSGFDVELFQSSNLKVGVVVPLLTGIDNRFFDAEIIAAWNRRF